MECGQLGFCRLIMLAALFFSPASPLLLFFLFVSVEACIFCRMEGRGLSFSRPLPPHALPYERVLHFGFAARFLDDLPLPDVRLPFSSSNGISAPMLVAR